MLLYVSWILRTKNIFENIFRFYYTSQKPLDHPASLSLSRWDFIITLASFSLSVFTSLSLSLPFIYLISLLLASLMRYTIVFYIKSFLPCGLSLATRLLTGQFPSPPFASFFYLRDELLICDSTNFENVAAVTFTVGSRRFLVEN